MLYDFTIQAEKQIQLDTYIKEGLSGLLEIDYWNKRVVSLNVEINEVSNEIRFFKFWSKKTASKKEVILDELVDCLHFAFSLGNTLNNKLWSLEINKSRSIIEIYFDLSNEVMKLQNNLDIDIFKKMLHYLAEIAAFMNYSMDDLSNAYDIKNKINYERQDSGY